MGDLLTLANGLTFVILTNLVASLFFFRVDLTEEKRHSIKPVTKQILGRLDDVVYVEVYLDGDLNAEFNRFRNAIHETLEEFRVYSNGKVQYNFTNPMTALSQKAQTEFLQELASKGIQVLPVIETNEGERTEKRIVPGALVSYDGNEKGVMLFKQNMAVNSQENINQSIEGLEYELASAILTLNSEERKHVTFLTGHGELDSLQTASLRAGLREQYDVSESDSAKGDVVIVARPTQKFSEIDKLKLDQYIMQGGNVMFFIDQMHASMDSASMENNFAFPYETGLQDQLFKYGVRVNPDLVQDAFCAKYPVVVTDVGGQPQIMPLEWPFFPLVYRYANHPITKNMDASITRFISSIDSVRADGVKKTVLFTTSEYSRKLSAPVKVSVNDLRNLKQADFNGGTIPVAWLLEGNFTSLYKNRFLPDGASKNDFRESGTGKVIVVGDGDFVRNDVNPRNGAPQELGKDPISGRVFANERVVMNMVAYLTDQGGLITARSKEIDARPLKKDKVKNERVKWQAINLALPIVIIVLGGLLLSWIRKESMPASEKKNKQLALSLIAMIIMIVAFWFFAFRESKIEVDENALVVPDLANVDRVEIGKIVLKFDGVKWMVNDQYPADRRAIQVLFGTIENVRPRRPVGEKQVESVMKELQAHGTVVRFYSSDNLLKTYTVGGVPSKPEAWFQVGESEPVIVNIPGYRVYAAGVFEQPVNDWRDKRVFSLNWRNFKKLDVVFKKNVADGFTISGKGRDFTVEGLNPVDTAKVNTYLDDISLLVGEGFYQQGQRAQIDSVVAGPTSFDVVVTDIGNRQFRFEVFPPLRNEPNVFGRVNGEIMIFPKSEIVRIAKKKSWFRPLPE
ncbi:MAG: gliding motility-associated ABC transporter substrate-binding protein GldG [Bacteroidota bacterium]